MIEKKIHQTYADIKKIPLEINENIKYLKIKNEKWEYKLYDDEDVWTYLEKHLSTNEINLLRKINPKYGVVIADIFRYVVIYNEGGVYLDIKSTSKRKLDEILKADDSYVISQWQNRLGELYAGAGFYPELWRIYGGEFQQWHVIGEKNHPFLEEVIHRVLFNIKHYNKNLTGVGKIGVLRLSGPIIYTQTIFNMLGKYNCRIVNSREQGLVYSIYEEMGKKGFHSVSETHYSKQREPIVL